MLKLIDKALDWLPGSGVVYITAAMVGLTAASGVISEGAPEGGETATAWLLRGAAWLGGFLEIYRRGMEVPSILRGVKLPTDAGMVLTAKRGNTAVHAAAGLPVSDSGTGSTPGTVTLTLDEEDD